MTHHKLIERPNTILKNPKKLSFIIPFFWALICGFALQLYIFPHFFSQTYWGHGLITGDWTLFHTEAVDFAKNSTWGHLSFSSIPLDLAPSYPLGLLYFVFGIYEPWVMLPLNALVHGLTCYILFCILRKMNFSPSTCFIATIPLAFFPSSLELFGLVHRDGFVFLAHFMLTYAIMLWFSEKKESLVFAAVNGVLGIALLAIFRPYLLNLFFVILFSLFLYAGIFKRTLGLKKIFILLPLSFLCLYLGQSDSRFNKFKSMSNAPPQESPTSVISENSFDRAFPRFVRKQFLGIAEVRNRAKEYYPNAGSNAYFDLEVQTPTKFLLALPTILKMAIVEPIPFLLNKQKQQSLSLIDRISLVESIIHVIMIAILIYFIIFRKRRIFFLPIYISLLFLILGSAAAVNLGSLYRARLGYLLTLSTLGLALTSEYFESYLKQKFITRPNRRTEKIQND